MADLFCIGGALDGEEVALAFRLVVGNVATTS